MQRTLENLLEKKGSTVWSVAPTQTVYRAIELMAKKGIGALVVLDGERLAGIISERDYTWKVILRGRSSHETKVSEIMTARVVCGEPTWTVEECMAMMSDRKIRHLPVLRDRQQLIGLVSIGDVVKAVIEERGVMIDHLQRYILGH